MAIQIFNTGDCTQDATGTAVRNCDKSTLGDLKGLVNFNKGWFKAITDGNVDFDLAGFITEIKSLKAFPLNGMYDFGQDTPENETNTSSTGIIQEVRAGKPQFSFMFTKGSCFHKSLFNKRGQARWDFGFVFENGILMAYNSDVTKLKGFDGGMFNVESYKLLQGTDLEMSTAKIQLLNAIEWNERNVFIPFDVAGDIGGVDGVVEVSIAIDPISAGTSFTASITSSCNKADSILDLDELTNFVLLGTQTSATGISAVSYDANTSKYTFTVDEAFVPTDTVQIQLNDGTYKVVEDSEGALYKGTSSLVTVIGA